MSKRFGRYRVPNCECLYNFTCRPCFAHIGPTLSNEPDGPRYRTSDRKIHNNYARASMHVSTASRDGVELTIKEA